MPDNTLSTLAQIQIKARRLTRAPDEDQLTTAELNNYINTFVLYDFPEILRANIFRTTLTFYTRPYIDTYSTNTTDLTDPLYNFKNKYTSVHDPVYVAGYKSSFTQSRDGFYTIFPLITTMKNVGVGNNVTINFTGTLSAFPILRNNVLFSSVSALNLGLQLHDDGNGLLTGDGNGTINYVTGAYNITFTTPPGIGKTIYAQTYPYTASRPTTVLFYQDYFVVRPVPDMAYAINCEAYVRPDELMATGDMPALSELWQFIAYGTAKKIFEDRMDMESVQNLMPAYNEQKEICLSRTVVQNGNKRVATLYNSSIPYPPNFSPGWGGGSF